MDARGMNDNWPQSTRALVARMPRRFLVLAVVSFVASLALLSALFAPSSRIRHIDNDASDAVLSSPNVPGSAPAGAEQDKQDLSAGNATLGFQALLALSTGTHWRVDGLNAAARASGINLLIPDQPKWSTEFIHSFEIFGGIDAHGAAMAWLGHIDLLKFVIQNRWGSALIMEDDMDWDVRIRKQTPMIAKGVKELTSKKKGLGWGKKEEQKTLSPYGDGWDVLWLGHCSDPPDEEKPMVAWPDDTVINHERYSGIDRHMVQVLKEGERGVHRSRGPLCTFAYAVSNEGAKKVLALASTGKGGAFDLMLRVNCIDGVLNCISVNPEIFDAYHPAGGDVSEVRAKDAHPTGDESFDKSVQAEMGHTDNILQSARCKGLWGKTCLSGD